MSYDALTDRLGRRDDPVTFTAFPDGSRDVHYSVASGDGRVASRETFGRRLVSGAESFRLDHRGTDPGGQAVNAATQAHALDAEVTLVGLLDDPLFDELPFRTASIGTPSSVTVYEFDDGDLLMADPSPATDDWTLDALADALGDRFEAAMGADALFCGNWISFDGMTAALENLADADAALDGVFVFDPGDVTDADTDALTTLGAALEALDDRCDVFVSVDGRELARVGDAVGIDVPADDVDERAIADVRDRIDVSGLVRHETDAATAAVRGRTVTVPNLSVEDAVTQTGAGDRFGAGLACALAREWGIETALALGNCCASQFVATGETGDRETLRDRAREADG